MVAFTTLAEDVVDTTATSALAVLMNFTGSPTTFMRSFLPRPRTSPRSLLAFSAAGSQAPTTLSPSLARTIFAMPTPMGPRPIWMIFRSRDMRVFSPERERDSRTR